MKKYISSAQDVESKLNNLSQEEFRSLYNEAAYEMDYTMIYSMSEFNEMMNDMAESMRWEISDVVGMVPTDGSFSLKDQFWCIDNDDMLRSGNYIEELMEDKQDFVDYVERNSYMFEDILGD